MSSCPLRVAIECRIPNVKQGHGTAITLLARALSGLKGDTQKYSFLVSRDLEGWLEPHVSGLCEIIPMPAAKETSSRWKKALAAMPRVDKALRSIPLPIPPVPVSDGFVERERFDIVHFPTQMAYITSIPSVYQPWDLQHVHYPQFFSQRDLAIRDRFYRSFCASAAAVCVQAQWTRQDLMQSYGVPPEKIHVVPWAVGHSDNPSRTGVLLPGVRERFGLPADFFFYPAVTWPHKNHAVILRALALLKQQHGRKIAVCFTGTVTPFNETLQRMAKQLGVQDQIHRLGYISAEDLQSIYASSAAMIFPSLFEGFGLPVLEAFQAGLPVLCSNATVLPEIARDGALYFAANSETELAGQILRILDDPDLRGRLRAAGSAVLKRYDLTGIANGFQAIYASVAE